MRVRRSRPTPSSPKRRFVLISLLLLTLSAIPVIAVHDLSLLELDANITDDAAAGIDWGALFTSGTPGGSVITPLAGGALAADFAHDGFFTAGSGGHDGDAADPTNFATGSKDTLDIPQWQCAAVNNPTDKDDIMHAYAALFKKDTTPANPNDPDHVILYVALERFANTGAGEVSFWILQDPTVGCTSSGSATTFTGAHVVGDLLIVSEFTQGGAISSLNVYEWTASGLNTTAVASGVDCDVASSGDMVCGNVNTGTISTPWFVQDKSSSPNQLAVSEFFEAGIDLTALIPSTNADGCVNRRVIANTRTSPSLTATLKDFALLNLSTCGSIEIIKDTIPNDPQDFSYSTTGGLSPSSFSLDDDADGTLSNTQIFTNVNPGTYTVTEAAVTGFTLTSLVCNDPTGNTTTNLATGTATIVVDGNETVTCTYTNTKQGTIVIIKDTVPDDPQDFTFTNDIPGCSPSFSLDDDADGTLSNTQTCSNVAPGTYTVTETLPVTGFNLANLSCVDPDNGSSTNLATGTATIDLDAGETVTCTYTNTKEQPATIIIIKDTVPDDPQDFTFTNDIPGCSPSFSLDDDSDGTLSNSKICNGTLSPGTYMVTEAAVAGFDLTNLVCVDPDDGSSTNLATGTATIDLDAGETVTCTYTNTKRGKIIVEKQTDPDGDPQSFSFSGDLSGSISDGQMLMAEVVPGTYMSTETVPSGWDLTSIVCDDTDSSGDLGQAKATYIVAPGETVTCVFTNTKRGKIIVEKQTDPDGDPQSFSFSGDLSGSISDGQMLMQEVVPGAYSTTETVPAGWKLLSIVCDDTDSTGEVGQAVANYIVAAGETVTCVFTNQKLSTIIIHKDAIPDDPQDFTFNNNIPGCSPSFQLDDDADGTLSNTQICDGTLDPGTYTVTEIVPSGWDLTNIVCSDPDNETTVNLDTATATIDLDSNETVECTFTNTKRGKIIVEKQTLPDGDPQLFTFSGDLAGNIGDGQMLMAEVQPGTYMTTETVPSGWTLTDITCDDTNSTGDLANKKATYNVEPGEIVKCIFTNTKHATIIIQKRTVPSPDPTGTNFEFTDNTGAAGCGSFTLTDGQSKTCTSFLPGTYIVTEVNLPAIWNLTAIVCSPSAACVVDLANKKVTITVGAGQTVTVTFENSICTGEINGVKYLDYDGDGNKDPDEPFLSGITITLTGTTLGGTPVSLTTTTNAQGQFFFTNLLPGTYLICEVLPPGLVQTFPREGGLCPGGTKGHIVTLVNCETKFVKFADMPDVLEMAELTVTGFPALSTANSVRFQVTGFGIQEINVRVYDLKGRLVFQGSAPSNGLTWALEDQTGRRVARGVYLYLVTARGHHGEVTTSKLQKLLVRFEHTASGATPTDGLMITAVRALQIQEMIYFVMAGSGTVKDLQVRVFDLQGREVYRSGWQSGGWAWNLQDGKGQRVARGVYLYVISARDRNDKLIQTAVQKLSVK